MDKSTRSHRYTRTAVVLHWLIALMIIGQLIGGKVMMWLDPTGSLLGISKFELFQLHKSFGFIILALSLFRLIWRLMHKAPPLPSGMKAYEKASAKLTHIGFYGFMIGLPLSGWAMVSVSSPRITTKVFDVLKVPDLPLPRSEAMEALTKNIHEYAAYLLIALLVLHIGAALKHHFVNKDDVLSRMVPQIKPKG